MNIFKKIFSSNQHEKANSDTPSAPTETLQQRTDRLWQGMEATLTYYDGIACACAFPRFHQYVQMDCVDTSSSFYMSETEGLIFLAKKYFDIQDLPPAQEAVSSLYTCKKCGSTYQYGWQDFSIHVNRTFLKVVDLKVAPIGADIRTPTPFAVGFFGHKLPDRNNYELLSVEDFISYLQALK